MTDVDVVARELAARIEKRVPDTDMRLNHVETLKARFAVIIATALRSRDAEWQGKVDEAEAQAAAMVKAVDDLIETAGPVRVRLAIERAGCVAAARAIEAVIKASGTTAGRALLAEVERLRGENKRLTDENHMQAATINGLRLPRADWP